MERRTCAITLALGLVLLGVVAAVAAGLLFPYTVGVPATLVGASGDVQRARPHQRPQPLDPRTRLLCASAPVTASSSPPARQPSRSTVCGRVSSKGRSPSPWWSLRAGDAGRHLVASRRFTRDYTLTL